MDPDFETERKHAQILDDDDFVYTRTVHPETKEVKVWSGGYRIRSPLLEGILSYPSAPVGGAKSTKQKSGPFENDDFDEDADADATTEKNPDAYAVPFGLHVVMTNCKSVHTPNSTLPDLFKHTKAIDDDLFERLFALSQYGTTKTLRRKTMKQSASENVGATRTSRRKTRRTGHATEAPTTHAKNTKNSFVEKSKSNKEESDDDDASEEEAENREENVEGKEEKEMEEMETKKTASKHRSKQTKYSKRVSPKASTRTRSPKRTTRRNTTRK